MRLASLIGWSLVSSASAQPLVPSPRCELDSSEHEASGLLLVDGMLWTVLDSGNPHAIFQVDPVTCAVTRSLTLPNAVNTDWEDLAMDDAWVYVGDFGNNGGNRTDLRVYRIPLAALLDEGVTEVLADSIRFAYVGQTDFTLAYDANNWDCEAFVARNDSLFLFSKNWLTSDCYLYALPAAPGEYLAIRRDTLQSEGLVSGASLDMSNGDIALIGHTTGYETFAWRLSGYPMNDLFNGIAERHAVTAFPMQTEGIAWASTDSVLLCTETSGPLPARLWSMELPFVDGLVPHASSPVLRAYPDPASDRLMVDSESARMVELRDASGRTVARWTLVKGITEHDVRHLPPGRYTLGSGHPGINVPVVIGR